MIFSREKWLALQHFGKDATSTPDINFDIVLLPGEHDFRGSVITCRNISSHLGVLDTSKTEITNLQIAILVDQDVTWLEVAMNDTGRVNIFQTALKKIRSDGDSGLDSFTNIW